MEPVTKNTDPKVAKIIQDGTLLYTFPRYFSGWEADSEGWVFETPDGKRHLILSDHCRRYVGTVEELDEMCTDYRGAIAATGKAKSLLLGT